MRLALVLAFGAAVLALGGCQDDDAREAAASPTATVTAPVTQASVTVPGVTRGAPETPTPDDGRVTLVVEGSEGSSEVRVELARTAQEITTGLMHRDFMPDDEGMLFIFEQPSSTGFWMRNTFIPLDIAYLAADGRIDEIRRGEPLNETILRPDQPYSYVLEVNAGWFESRGLGVGDRVVIPEAVLAN